MSEFEVGDTVWCLIYGKGVVVGILDDEPKHPVCVEFPDTGFRAVYYTVDGKYHYKGNRTLFFSEPKVEAATAKPFVSKILNSYVAYVTLGGELGIGFVIEDNESSFTIAYNGKREKLEKSAMGSVKKITIEPTNYV